MHLLIQIAFLLCAFALADMFHVDRHTCIILGWMAAAAYGLVERYQSGKSEKSNG